MIAIPVESNTMNTMSTKLFGNAKYFALVNPLTDSHTIVKNEGCGNGIKTADFLLKKGAKSAVYGFLGDGPFNTMMDAGMSVYWLGKETLPLENAIHYAISESLVKVTPENADIYLDPGTSVGACECGCTNE